MHPYYPTSLILSYVPNDRSVPELLLIMGSLLMTVMIISYSAASEQSASPFKFTWFTVCGCLHILFEGYWYTHRHTISVQNDILAQLWKEYAHGDSRYMVADDLLVTLEAITIFVWGPLCVITCICIWNRSSLQYFFQLITSVCHIISCTLYFIMEYDAIHCDPDYYYTYFIGCNIPWIVIPLCLIYNSYHYYTYTLPNKQK